MTWYVTIPFKGAPLSKSRLAERLNDTSRHALAVAFLQDTVSAVRRTADVASVLIVSNEPGLTALFAVEAETGARVEIVPDPGDGLNAAIAQGILAARAADPDASVAVLLGDLPELTADELAEALGAAARHPLAYTADASGTGTTMIALAPGVTADPRFGVGSAAAHAAAGFSRLDVPASSGLRRDVDAPQDLDALRAPGAHTRAVLALSR
ncbi:2-phospho-L-lactate guanylyltransferase [Gryllotalpicola reticulitermitis]|uniref:Phosphoenolpyruvate guanylyltransferase n=1 Tax=Gryllotalpicola reticulitermitis TaxID=1184153 RepID=A0ABV8Q8H9_9MICO